MALKTVFYYYHRAVTGILEREVNLAQRIFFEWFHHSWIMALTFPRCRRCCKVEASGSPVPDSVREWGDQSRDMGPSLHWISPTLSLHTTTVGKSRKRNFPSHMMFCLMRRTVNPPISSASVNTHNLIRIACDRVTVRERKMENIFWVSARQQEVAERMTSSAHSRL